MNTTDIRTLVLLLIFAWAGTTHASTTSTLPWIEVSKDQKGFVIAGTEKRFTPYGFNYAPDNRMIEDSWSTNSARIEEDFREMAAMGANVARVHLQIGKFMEAPDRMSTVGLAKLREWVGISERTGVYLDLTGLGCYKPEDTPRWYEESDEAAHWNQQAFFWSNIAEVCSSSSAVFCYDLINEPLSPGEKREAGKWRSGSLFGGFDFLQYIALDPAGRSREEIAAAWMRKMRDAIRAKDKRHMVTVGLVGWDEKLHNIGGFAPADVGRELDFMCVHVYPEKGKVAAAVEDLKKFATNKPMVIEELFPLHCTGDEIVQFMLDSRGTACGWVGHYFGDSPEAIRAMRDRGKVEISQLLMLDWLERFQKLHSALVGTDVSQSVQKPR